MKKITALIISLAIIVSLGITVGAANLTSSDALTILKAATGSITLTAEQQAKYDIDGDGQITTADALAALRSAVGASGAELGRDNSQTPANLPVWDGETMEFAGRQWLVLEKKDGKALILSKTSFTQHAYHDEWVDVTWETSDIRKYLNDVFYNLFNDNDKARIVSTTVANNDNPWFGTPGGNNTTDKIFLLSFNEVVGYFGDSGQLKNRPSETTWRIDDKYNDARKIGGVGGWWLRSPGYKSTGAGVINTDGTIALDNSTANGWLEVRPAMWVSL